jgi:hypothetical protein
VLSTVLKPLEETVLVENIQDSVVNLNFSLVEVDADMLENIQKIKEKVNKAVVEESQLISGQLEESQ